MPKYKVVIDHWGDVELPPRPSGWSVNSEAWTGNNAATATAVYAVACHALKVGGGYRSNVGVFFYTDGEITDRYLIEDGRYVSLRDLQRRSQEPAR